MELIAKLQSLSSENTVFELNQMLDHAQVSISNWGQRLVSVDGYEESVEINELALKYLKAAPFYTESSLQDRLTCEALWGRVQQLYTDSEAKLANTSLYKYLVPMRESRPYCRACAGDPMAIIGEWDSNYRKSKLFEFSPEEFKKIWPDTEPEGKSRITGSEGSFERWTASKEMVESALKV